ncbi:hypothetical protein ACHAW6_006089 [Cyclotella cf. meneghiniana]
MTSSSAELHLDDRVTIATITSEDNERLEGIVAHLGPVKFAPELDWVGIQLTGPSVGKGEHDGTVDGVFYFDARGETNGLFVKSVNVKVKIESSGAEASNKLSTGSTSADPPLDADRSNQMSSENSHEFASNPDSGTSPGLNIQDSMGGFKSVAESFSPTRPAPPTLSGMSASSSDDDTKSVTCTAAAAASRENFLRRLELQQKQQRSDGDQTSGGRDKRAKHVSFAGIAESASSDLLDETETRKETNTAEVTERNSSSVVKTNSIEYEGVGGKEALLSASNVPRGNQNDHMTTLVTYLSRQRNLTKDQSSLDWITDVDASSLVFLNELAGGNSTGNVNADEFSSSLFLDPATLRQPSESVSPLSYVGGALLSTTQSDIIPQESFQRASDEVLKGRKIIKVTSPSSTEGRPTSSSDAATAAKFPEQLTPIEDRMLTMIERQHNQIQELQARLEALGNMMSQMSNDVRYLCESQRRRDLDEGRMTGNLGGYRLTDFIAKQRAGRIPPPPPPLPPMLEDKQARAAAMDAQTPPNQQPPVIGVPRGGRPFNRGLLFPLATYMLECIASFVRNFRSILLSTGPGRVYAHVRNEAIRRRAFANVDLMSLVKLLVMLLVFSGRMGRDGDGNRNRRGGARRAQENNDDGGEEGLTALVAGFMQTAIAFVRAHRVHLLVIASMIGFLVQTGLMSFFYEVFWLEREELLHVWLGRRDQAEDGGDDNNQLEGAVRADGLEHNMNAEQGGNRQAVAAQAGAGPNVNRVRDILRRGRNDRQANINRRPGGMIRRAPDGGVFHDIQCLIFSFILSLIPAWKPEEAAPPPGIQQAQQGMQREQQRGADETAEDEDGDEDVR